MSDFLLAEGFGNLTDGAHTAGVTREILGEQWSSFAQDFSLTDIGDGRKWLTTPDANDKLVTLQSGTIPGALTEVWCAFLIYPTDRSECLAIRFRDTTNVLGFIGVNGAGEIVYVRWPNFFAGYVEVANGGVLPLDTITHIEVRVKFDNAVGEVDIYVNGILTVSETNVDTIHAGAVLTNLQACGTSGTYGVWPGDWRITDIILHTVGTPIGDASVYYLPASADGAETDFTPSAGGDHFAMVDEIGPDEDATYNESDGTAGHRDSFENAGISSATILSVGSLARARKTGAGTGTLLLGAWHGGSEDQGAAKGLSADYLSLVEFFDVCPSTAAQWTAAEVSAAELTAEVGA